MSKPAKQTRADVMAIGPMKLKTRQVEAAPGVMLQVPSGIARNNRNKSWQVQIVRNGEKVFTGNYADKLYSGPEQSLAAAIDAIQVSIEVDEELLSKAAKIGVQRKGLSVAPHLILMWRVINKTPTLYANVYAPFGQDKGKQKSVVLCNDRKTGPDQFKLDRLARALVLADRVSKQDPNKGLQAPVTEQEIAVKYQQAFNIFNLQETQELLRQGMRLRAELS